MEKEDESCVLNWEVFVVDHSDELWGVGRSVTNSDGKFQYQKYHRTFNSELKAKQVANELNKES